MKTQLKETIKTWITTAQDSGIKIVSISDESDLELWLTNGKAIPCLVVGLDELGNWSVLDKNGRTVQYLANEVKGAAF